jgi:CIC family chloride channel protein
VSRQARRALRLWRLYLLRLEIRLAPTEPQRLFLLTVAIGGLCGLAAVAFHFSIDFCEAHLIEPALHMAGNAWIPWTIATPLVGGVICGVLLHYVFPGARGSGIPQVKVAFASSPPVVPVRDAVGKFFVGSLQIGSGASLGREGPTVQICAGLASLLGSVVGVSAKTRRRLLPVGVAAGIAAAFNAPIAAVTFTIEEVVGNLDQAMLSGVIVAAALAAVIERSILGENAVFEVPSSYGLHHASSLVLYAGIGVATGLMATAFTESLLWLRVALRRVRWIPAWARPGLGGAATGLLAVVGVIAFKVTGVTGGGYATLESALKGQYVWWVLLGLSGLKLLATVTSYSSGGAGGIFAPALFIGGTLGGAVGTLDATWFHHFDEAGGAFALVGMGAMFAGVIRAPLTSVLIIIEMTRAYSLILPLMIANMTAYVLARRFRVHSVYEALLEQDGIELSHPGAPGDSHRVSSYVHHPLALGLGTSGEELLLRCRKIGSSHVFPVVDAERHVLGLITHEEIAMLETSTELVALTTASDLMRPPVTVRADDDLALVIERMLASGLRELPVTDAGGHLLGYVDDQTVVQAYQQRALAPRAAEAGSQPPPV